MTPKAHSNTYHKRCNFSCWLNRCIPIKRIMELLNNFRMPLRDVSRWSDWKDDIDEIIKNVESKMINCLNGFASLLFRNIKISQLIIEIVTKISRSDFEKEKQRITP